MDVLELALDELCRDVERRFSEDLLELWRQIQQQDDARVDGERLSVGSTKTDISG